ncbi:MAG: hypothetical protein ACLPY2_21060 [Bryobacteraceae bacterium]|jgi:hypothetical protein
MRQLWWSVLVCFLTPIAFPADGPESVMLRTPPVHATLPIGGQSVGVTAWAELSGRSDAPLHFTVTADLAELQSNVTPLLAVELNRSNRCGERLEVQSATLAAAAPSALLNLHVHYERWACAKAMGREIAKRLVGGNAVLEVRLNPSVESNAPALHAEVRNIDADGSLGEALKSGSLGDTLREKIRSSVESAVAKAASAPALPPGVGGVAQLRGAAFRDGGQGRLWLTVEGEVRVAPDQLRALTAQLQAK